MSAITSRCSPWQFPHPVPLRNCPSRQLPPSHPSRQLPSPKPSCPSRLSWLSCLFFQIHEYIIPFFTSRIDNPTPKASYLSRQFCLSRPSCLSRSSRPSCLSRQSRLFSHIHRHIIPFLSFREPPGLCILTYYPFLWKVFVATRHRISDTSRKPNSNIDSMSCSNVITSPSVWFVASKNAARVFRER